MTRKLLVLLFFSFVFISDGFAFSSKEPEEIDLSLFCEVFNIIKNKHILGEKIDKETIIIGAVNGMLKSLDSHSRFQTPKEAELDNMRMRGEFCGIGIVVREDERGVFVDSVLDGSPADKVGIRSEDIIVCIDGDRLACFDIEETYQKLQGDASSALKITVERNFETEISFEVKRELIELKTVSFEKYYLSDKKIAVIKITQFSANTFWQFLQVLVDVRTWTPNGILFDLRDNPGGLLYVVRDICASIVGPNKIIYQEEFRDGKREICFSKSKIKVFEEIPLAILVNKNSASASEIMTACLRDNMGSVVFGMRTYGKGSAQIPVLLDSGKGTCVITVEKWLTPKGECIWGRGLIPDVLVRRRPYDKSGDVQLKAALEKFINQLQIKKR